MISLQLKMCGIRFKRGVLFGEYHEYPIWVFEFLLISIVWNRGKSAGILLTAMNGLAQDKDWLIENRKEIRLLKKRLRSKYRKAAKLEYEENIEEWRQEYYKAEEERQKLASEVQTLRGAIKLIGDT